MTLTKTQLLIIASITMLVLVFATAYAQSASEVYLPLIRANPNATSTPAATALPSTPTPTGGAVIIADITMPFNVLGGVDPSAVQDRLGYWYISVFRIDSGANNGLWIVRWKEGDATATPIGLAVVDAAGVAIQSAPISNSRGIVAHNFDGSALYGFGWFDIPGGSRKPKLRAFRVLDYNP